MDQGKGKNMASTSNCIVATREALRCGDKLEDEFASEETFVKDSLATINVHISDEELSRHIEQPGYISEDDQIGVRTARSKPKSNKQTTTPTRTASNKERRGNPRYK